MSSAGSGTLSAVSASMTLGTQNSYLGIRVLDTLMQCAQCCVRFHVTWRGHGAWSPFSVTFLFGHLGRACIHCTVAGRLRILYVVLPVIVYLHSKKHEHHHSR